MGRVFEFVARLADHRDWSPAERAQLRDLGAQIADTDEDLDVVFGQSEDGDPWCAVTDAAGEVVLHVARIAGAFVVHSARDDRILEGADLWTTAARLLGDFLKERRGMVVPFRREALSQFVILAFIFAAALHDDLAGLLDGSFVARPHHGDPDLAAADDAAASVAAGDEVRSEAAGTEAAQGADVQPPHDLLAAIGDAWARFVPHADSLPRGGGGQAATAEASGDQTAAVLALKADFAIGGAGDDHLLLGQKVAAIGGRGADAFVLNLPAQPGDRPALLGAVLDFDAREGDRLSFSEDGKAVMVSNRPEANVLAAFGGPNVAQTGPNAPTLPGRHIGYDVDGDGTEDAYVLVANGSHDWAGRFDSANAGGASSISTVLGGGRVPERAEAPAHVYSFEGSGGFGGPIAPSVAIQPHDMEY